MISVHISVATFGRFSSYDEVAAESYALEQRLDLLLPIFLIGRDSEVWSVEWPFGQEAEALKWVHDANLTEAIVIAVETYGPDSD